jgi:hypothetical protein
VPCAITGPLKTVLSWPRSSRSATDEVLVGEDDAGACRGAAWAPHPSVAARAAEVIRRVRSRELRGIGSFVIQVVGEIRVSVRSVKSVLSV